MPTEAMPKGDAGWFNVRDWGILTSDQIQSDGIGELFEFGVLGSRVGSYGFTI